MQRTAPEPTGQWPARPPGVKRLRLVSTRPHEPLITCAYCSIPLPMIEAVSAPTRPGASHYHQGCALALGIALLNAVPMTWREDPAANVIEISLVSDSSR